MMALWSRHYVTCRIDWEPWKRVAPSFRNAKSGYSAMSCRIWRI